MARLEIKGYLNDENFAYTRALGQKRHRHWGSKRIAQDLRARGVDDAIIARILRQVETEIAELQGLEETIQHWIERSGSPKTASQLKKLFDRCSRLGYQAEAIRQQLQPYFEKIRWE